ncbi:MAG: DnaJ C-terminal domain-containing protein, partial [Vulcanimicrobiota bacterium]
EELCEECNGKGKTINKRKISVKVPAGIDNGNRIRIPDEGEAGEFGGPEGDLYIFIHVKEHEHFERHGRDLFTDLKIGFADAALGTKMEVDTFDGRETIDIKEGIQTDTVITLKGKGMPDIRSGKKGDLKINIKVITPTRLSKKQREYLCKFAEEGPQFHCEKKSIFKKIMDAITGK